MIEQSARVIAVHNDRIELIPEAASACGSCQTGHCGASIFGRAFGLKSRSFWLDNVDDARVGDQVVIGLGPAALQLASITLYLVPLIGLLVAAMIASSFFYLAEPLVILSGLFGAVASFGLVRYISGQQERKGRWQARILRVIRHNVAIDSIHS